MSNETRKPDWPPGLVRRGKTYWYDRSINGTRFKCSLKTKVLRVARRAAEDINEQHERGVDIRDEYERRRARVADLFQGRLDELAVQDKLAAKQKYAAIFERFLGFLATQAPSVTAIADVTATIAEAYINWRRSTPVAPNGHPNTKALRLPARKTLCVEIETLRSTFQLAVKRGLLNENPIPLGRDVVGRSRAREGLRIRLLEDDEIGRLLEKARTYDEWKPRRAPSEGTFYADVFTIFLYTGLRDQELRHLQWSDIDFTNGVLHIREKRVHEVRVQRLPKAGLAALAALANGRAPSDRLFDARDAAKWRQRLRLGPHVNVADVSVAALDLEGGALTTECEYVWKPKATQGDVPMCESVRHVLQSLPRTSSFVFPGEHGGINGANWLKQLKACAAQAGLRNASRIRIHDLRHSFAGRLRRRGVPLETIMGLMRHQDIRETLIYAPYDRVEGRRAIMQLDEPIEAPCAATPA